mgnify:CR=1 FL=1
MGFGGASEPLRHAAGKENVGACSNAFANAHSPVTVFAPLVATPSPTRAACTLQHPAMNLFLIGCAAVLVFAFIGFRRGVLRILAFFGSLLVAGLVASPLSRLALPLFERTHIVPRTLVSLGALLAAGLFAFIVVCAFCDWLLRRRERRREAEKLPRLQGWERLSGALFGGLWGAALFVLGLAGLHQLASIQQALEKGGLAPDADRKPLINYNTVKDRIEASPLAPVVAAANPHDAKIARIFGDLATVTGDPVLLDRFKQHPSIARLIENPELLRVAQDKEILQLLDQRRYYELLDHPKLAALLKDRELVAACGQVDLDAVLGEVLRRPAATPAP